MIAARFLAALLLIATSGLTQAVEFRKQDIVHQEKSLYRNIVVLERDGIRCMKFGVRDGRQGCINVNDPKRIELDYFRAAFASFYAVPKPHRVLVIGLGCGVMPMAIRVLDPDVRIDSVELDPAIVSVARRHFGFREDARSRVHVGDGRMFVRKQLRAGIKYDLILLDAFDKKYIPEHMLTREFMEQLKGILNARGVVAANTFAYGSLQGHEIATYQAVFGRIAEVNSGAGNRILLAGRDGLPSLAAMTSNARMLDPKLAQLQLSSTELVPSLRMLPKLRYLRPLTDQYSPVNLLLDY